MNAHCSIIDPILPRLMQIQAPAATKGNILSATADIIPTDL